MTSFMPNELSDESLALDMLELFGNDWNTPQRSQTDEPVRHDVREQHHKIAFGNNLRRPHKVRRFNDDVSLTQER